MWIVSQSVVMEHSVLNIFFFCFFIQKLYVVPVATSYPSVRGIFISNVIGIFSELIVLVSLSLPFAVENF